MVDYHEAKVMCQDLAMANADRREQNISSCD